MFSLSKSTGGSSHSSDSSKQMTEVTTLKGVAEIVRSCDVIVSNNSFDICRSDLYNTEILHCIINKLIFKLFEHLFVKKVCKKSVSMSFKTIPWQLLDITLILSFLTEEGNSEPIVQQTELLGYLFKLLAPHQVSEFIRQSVYQKHFQRFLGEGYAGLVCRLSRLHISLAHLLK